MGRTTAGGSGRAAVVAVSTAAMGLGSTPPFLLGYLGPEIRADLDLSRGQLGLLIGLFYGLTGAASLVTARIAEPLGPRRCVVIDLTLLTACLVGAVVSGSALLLAATAAVAGAGYSLTNAGTSMAVSAGAPWGRAGQDLTVKTAGVPMMATLLAVAGPPAGGLVGWQGVGAALAVLAAGTAGIAALVLPGRRAPGAVLAPSGAGGDRHLPPGFLLLPVAAFLFIGGSQPLLSWLVLSLTDAGLRAGAAGLISAAGTALGVLTMLLVSRVSDRVGPRRRAVVAVVSVATTAVGVAVLWSSSRGPVLLLVVGAGLGLMGNLAGASTVQAVVVDRVPWAVGRGIALMSAGYFAGAFVAPWVFGAAADTTGGYDLSWGICLSALTASAICFMVAQRRIPAAAEASGLPVAAPPDVPAP